MLFFGIRHMIYMIESLLATFLVEQLLPKSKRDAFNFVFLFELLFVIYVCHWVKVVD